eukprot:TRINITY_DN79_c2_g1_i1.p1 TRINITY_DN79_c2_g1~~TRINITY_DN79_c2_g1_i1.p1  ORF type:complete len:890 (+),score=275.72 TRINITY_DN79_c2_g1_i1:82-2670(+)
MAAPAAADLPWLQRLAALDLSAGLQWPALLLPSCAPSHIKHWLALAGVVHFDLRRGQVLEWYVPAAPAPAARLLADVAPLSMPDANTARGDQSLALCFTADAGSSTRGSAVRGYAHFVQHADATAVRGALQRAVVLLSALPFPGLFAAAARRSAEEYISRLVAARAAAPAPDQCDEEPVARGFLAELVRSVGQWGRPTCCALHTLPLFGAELSYVTPCYRPGGLHHRWCAPPCPRLEHQAGCHYDPDTSSTESGTGSPPASPIGFLRAPSEGSSADGSSPSPADSPRGSPLPPPDAAPLAPPATPATPSSPLLRCEGWLRKSHLRAGVAARLPTRPDLRWYELRGHVLSYRDAEQGGRRCGELDLRQAAVERRPGEAKAVAVRPLAALNPDKRGKAYLLLCDSEADCEKWVAALSQAAAEKVRPSGSRSRSCSPPAEVLRCALWTAEQRKAATWRQPSCGTGGAEPFGEVDPYVALYRHLPKLWKLWELLIVGDPILVLATAPDVAVAAVTALAHCVLRPMAYGGWELPYLTLQNSGVDDIARAGAARGCVLVGCANPYFAKLMAKWPHLLSFAPQPPDGQRGLDKDLRKHLEPKCKQREELEARMCDQLFSARRFVVRSEKRGMQRVCSLPPPGPDAGWLRPPGAEPSPGAAVVSELLGALTDTFLQPVSACFGELATREGPGLFAGPAWERFLELRRPQPRPTPAGWCPAPWADLPEPLTLRAFTQAVRADLGNAQSPRWRIFKQDRDALGVYLAFFEGPQFTRWLTDAYFAVWRETLTALSSLDEWLSQLASAAAQQRVCERMAQYAEEELLCDDELRAAIRRLLARHERPPWDKQTPGTAPLDSLQPGRAPCPLRKDH